MNSVPYEKVPVAELEKMEREAGRLRKAPVVGFSSSRLPRTLRENLEAEVVVEVKEATPLSPDDTTRYLPSALVPVPLTLM